MDSQAPEPHSLPASEPMNGGGNDAIVSNARGSAIRHLAILGSVLIPIAFLPYIVTRRRVTTLQRRRHMDGGLGPGGDAGVSVLLAQMRQELEAMREQDSQRAKSLSEMTMDVIHINERLDELGADILSARDVNSVYQGKDISREVQELVKTAEDGLHKLRQETQPALAELQDQTRLLRSEQEALRSELFKISDQLQSANTGPHAVDSSELHRLMLEARQTRAIFGSIGSSLGDVASIIQRVEIEMGHEHPGGYNPVEKLRVLAMRMQDEAFHERHAVDGRGQGFGRGRRAKEM
ncbi:hypothetical protein B0H17DRAFT_1068867 [Mycena rosella]|uniref:Uncharacterized protein n=1 Tax=Mycena rosella TaxID=1033263 RepID=A0AAD7DD40_MYCRO|nr:hypothetical protein B0H17DRAFT_1068867 [Mycena rosella]